MIKQWNDYAFLFDWELYALDSHQLNDYKAWLKIARRIGGNILELGCGSGRITEKLMLEGVAITGIDNSDYLIEKMRNSIKLPENCNILLGDMLSYHFPQQYNLAFYSYSTFQYLLTLEEQIQALQHIHKYIVPGGYIAFDICPSTCELPESQPKTLLYNIRNEELDSDILMFTSHNVDKFQQITHWQDTYIIVDDNGNRERFQHNLSLKGVSKDDLTLLLAQCGFKLVSIYGDFDLGEVTSDSDNLIYLAQKL